MALAESDVTLALYVGESFAEAHLAQQRKTLNFHRWYLGKESLRVGIGKVLQDSGIQKITKAFVASRFPEKIFSYRMGGSVAVLTTKGFENWPRSRQPAALKSLPLSAADLLFSVDERVLSDGSISKEPSESEITDLIDKLKLKQAKRVCIHFLNARSNPANQEKVKTALIQASFEVFTPDATASETDEVALWRKNILNASLSGTFEEIQEEIHSALQPYLPDGTRAAFLSGDGHFFDKEVHHRLSSLWGGAYAWAQGLKNESHSDILYLGLEQFCLLSPEKIALNWESPWGKVFNTQVQNHMLSLQPTTTIELNLWNELGFSKKPVGYEPGPMFLGRGQSPTLLDLWASESAAVKGLSERISPPGIQKFKNQMVALNRATTSPFDSEERVLARMRQNAIKNICADIITSSDNKRLLCLGALAPLFAPEIQKHLKKFEIKILPETETSFLIGQEK